MSEARCSFCDKGVADVAVLIQGTAGAYICDECAELCIEVVRDKKAGRSQRAAPARGIPPEIQNALHRLRTTQPNVEATTQPPPVHR